MVRMSTAMSYQDCQENLGENIDIMYWLVIEH